jgi:hypothetical protein
MNLRLVTASFAALACCCCGQNPPDLSDGGAKGIIEKNWNENFFIIPLGQLTVIGGLGAAPDRKIDTFKHELNRNSFHTMQIFEQMFIVALTQTEDVTKHFTWENWMATTQNGVQLRILASQGAKGEAFRCDKNQEVRVKKTYGDTNGLCVQDGKAMIERIVRNEVSTIGVDYYRVVLGTYIWTPSPIMQEFYKRNGKEQKPERKFMVALKYDAFNSGWHIAAADIADREGEFSTRNVNNLLAQK